MPAAVAPMKKSVAASAGAGGDTTMWAAAAAATQLPAAFQMPTATATATGAGTTFASGIQVFFVGGNGGDFKGGRVQSGLSTHSAHSAVRSATTARRSEKGKLV